VIGPVDDSFRDPAERVLFTKRRKEAYEALHPETRHGGDRASRRDVDG
jgi:hypothetical protein